MDRESVKYHLKSILNSYSEIFFIENYKIGLVLFLVLFLNPNMAVCGLTALFSAYIFAKFLNMEKEFLSSGFYTYNPLLVGLSIGFLFKLDPLTIFFTVTSGILTLVLSVMLHSIFSYYLKLPILSLPFVIISSTIYLSVSNYTNLFVNSLYPHFKISILENVFPYWLEGYFKSFGTILFLPDITAGLIFSFLILLISRILFFLSVLGYYSGTIASGLLTGSLIQAFQDISHFNFILISMALGGIFLIPSVKSYFISVVAVLSSTIILSATKTFWAFYGIPAFTLPFNTISLTFIYVLGLLGFPLMAKIIRKTPEETLDFYLTNIKRYRGYERTLYLPFSGKWTVWQGFDGKWTHKGGWKYAYDFVITDKDGRTFKGEGLNLDDYYAFRKPVLSPVRGRVVKVISDLKDNQIGEVDKENNWGNLVIIQDYRGFFVEISHLSYKSIKVKEGDWVEIGTFLGLCGNSGYSPQPHIHIQVQLTDNIGGATVPFSFVNFIKDNHFYSNDLPPENSIVEPIFPDKSLELKFSFVLDNRFEYIVLKDDEEIDKFELTVKMSPDGTFYFDSGSGKLYFGKYEGTFYFYKLEGDDKYLKYLFLSLPKIPLAYREGLEWVDYLPLKLTSNKIKISSILFLSSFNHNIAQVKYTGKFIDQKSIKGRVESKILNYNEEFFVEIDQFLGIKEIKSENFIIRLNKITYK
ncbi:urea transporter [Persephonella sp.]